MRFIPVIEFIKFMNFAVEIKIFQFYSFVLAELFFNICRSTVFFILR